MKGGNTTQKSKSLTTGSFFGLFVFGVIFNSLGPAMPYLITELGLSLTQAGTIYSFRGLGIVSAVLLSGIIADYFGVKRVIVAGAGCWVLGLLAFAFSYSSLAAILVWLFIGVGLGGIDTGLNTLVAQTNEKKGAALNRLHFWFGAGAVVGPLWAQLVLSVSSWRYLFALTSILALVFLVYMLRLPFPKISKNQDSPLGNFRQFWKVPILLLAVIAFGYTGVGTSFMGWINTYLITGLGASSWGASIVLTLYSLGLAIGRLVNSFIVERIKYRRMLLLSSVLSFASATVAMFSPNTLVVALSLTLTGFFFSSLLPTSLAIAANYFPAATGTITGLLITFGSIGRTVLPGLSGAVADLSGIAAGMQVMLVFVFAMVLASLGLMVHRKTVQKESEIQ